MHQTRDTSFAPGATDDAAFAPARRSERIGNEAHLSPSPRRPGSGRSESLAEAFAKLFNWPLPALVMLLCCGLPLAWLLVQIVAHPESLGGLRMDRFRLLLLGRTLGYNFAAAVIATVLALPAALVLGRGRGWVAALLWFLLPLTLLLPSITYSYGWSQLLRLLRINLEPAGRADVLRCVGSLAGWLWALPAGIIGLALRRLDPDLQQQAMLDGALWRVTARQLAGPIMASLACVAVLAVQEFAVYEPTGISVVATEVRQVFTTGKFSSRENPITAPMGGNGPAAAGDGAFVTDQRVVAAAAVTTAVPLLAVVAALGAVAALGVRRVSAAEEVDDAAWPAALDAGAPSKFLALLAVIVTLVLPTAAMVMRLQRPIAPVFIWKQSGALVVASVTLGAMAGTVALGIALAATMRRDRWSLTLSLATFLIGGQLLAIALIRLYNRRWLNWVYDGPPIMVVAYLARFGWLVLLAAGATWSRPWRRVREMAAVDGASAPQAALHVIWPLAWPMLGAASVLVLILSITEVPATVLISPLWPQPIIPMLMTWVHTLENDPMIEASLLLMTVVVVFATAALLLARFGTRLARRGLTPMGATGIRRSLNTAAALLFLCLVPMLATGCGDPRQPKAVWCRTGTGPCEVVYPRALTYSRADDSFYLIDRMARVQHLDAKGQFLNEWTMPAFAIGKPVGVSVGPDGNVYVPDTHYHRVVVYTPTGQKVREWGGPGTAPGQFIYPTDVAFDSKGRIFVSEYGEHDRIQVFAPSGAYLYEFGKFGNGPGEFSRPQSILIDGDSVYVTDACNHRLLVFKTDGTFVRAMGSVGSGLGEFRFPYGLDMDREGRLVVCEFGNNRVQLVDKNTGKGIKTWGAAGREPGQLAYPWGVAVDKRDRVVAVDAGNNRLQVFEF